MNFGVNFYINLISSIGGIIFFVYSLTLIEKIKKLFPGSKVTKKWIIREGLIVIFLVGYILNIIFLLFNLTELVLIMTALVYFFGGLFVFIIIKLVHKTYATILAESENKK
jgi:heme A synthase